MIISKLGIIYLIMIYINIGRLFEINYNIIYESGEFSSYINNPILYLAIIIICIVCIIYHSIKKEDKYCFNFLLNISTFLHSIQCLLIINFIFIFFQKTYQMLLYQNTSILLIIFILTICLSRSLYIHYEIVSEKNDILYLKTMLQLSFINVLSSNIVLLVFSLNINLLIGIILSGILYYLYINSYLKVFYEK